MTLSGSSLAGHLLIATPIITMPPFRRSVVYLGDHDHQGALGVVLNAPTSLTVDEVLPLLHSHAASPAVVHLGGPVQTDAAIVVARSENGPFAMPSTFEDIGLVDPHDPPSDVSELRVFAGFSGWSPGQLEEEIDGGSWWSTPAMRADLFTDDAEALWADAVRRVHGSVAMYATYPDDPSLN